MLCNCCDERERLYQIIVNSRLHFSAMEPVLFLLLPKDGKILAMLRKCLQVAVPGRLLTLSNLVQDCQCKRASSLQIGFIQEISNASSLDGENTLLGDLYN